MLRTTMLFAVAALAVPSSVLPVGADSSSPAPAEASSSAAPAEAAPTSTPSSARASSLPPPSTATPAASPSAQQWSLGGSFRIGDLRFQVGYHDADLHRGLYVRASRPLPGRHHHELCFERGGHVYHHPTCPLVRGYFHRHGYPVEQVLITHAPPPPVVYGRHPGRGRGRGRGPDEWKAPGAYGRGHGGLHIPPGHLPPPGECRIWYPGVPPGHQPPPLSCGEAYAWAPYGTVVVDGRRF